MGVITKLKAKRKWRDKYPQFRGGAIDVESLKV